MSEATITRLFLCDSRRPFGSMELLEPSLIDMSGVIRGLEQTVRTGDHYDTGVVDMFSIEDWWYGEGAPADLSGFVPPVQLDRLYMAGFLTDDIFIAAEIRESERPVSGARWGTRWVLGL